MRDSQVRSPLILFYISEWRRLNTKGIGNGWFLSVRTWNEKQDRMLERKWEIHDGRLKVWYNKKALLAQ